jgi:hypothetical protein
MLRSRWHVAWLVVWFIVTNLYTLGLLMHVIFRGINVSGPLDLVAFLLVHYTLPVVAFYLAGLAVGWLVPRAVRAPVILFRRFARA